MTNNDGKVCDPCFTCWGRLDANNNGVLSYLDGEVHERMISRALKRAREKVPSNANPVSNSDGVQQAPIDPVENARKNKKKKPRVAAVSQAEEMNLS
ncbi:hypothetical protein PIB30_040335 [Stylosanthes scabra]|uniref:Uncharacterized protein n=1 Tax=Stylosanthes scabra TaxID=79078 RepID=A0ABU6TFC8_9FABA|nr:hypothetical protein [Stylosanthes scabra]